MNREDKHTFLSIIIPVYNGLTHDLPICLESIWLQPLDPSQYEVICVDDCSTDDTRRWLDEEAAKHSNMRVIKHSVNKRQGGGRNTGVKVAKGKYLLFIDQDDYYHQGVLLKIYKHLSVNDLDVLVTDSTLEYKGQVNNLLQLNYRNHTIIDGETFVVVNGNPIAPWRFVTKRDFFMQNELYFEENTRIEDVDWGVKITYYAKQIQYLPILSVHYLKASTSTTDCLYKDKETIKDYIQAGVRTLDVANSLYRHSKARHKVVCLSAAYFDYGLKYMFGLNSSMRYKFMLLSFIPEIAENSQLVSFAKKHPNIICAMSMISVPFFRAFRKYRQLKKAKELCVKYRQEACV